jgi:hypothetical protein
MPTDIVLVLRRKAEAEEQADLYRLLGLPHVCLSVVKHVQGVHVESRARRAHVFQAYGRRQA